MTIIDENAGWSKITDEQYEHWFGNSQSLLEAYGIVRQDDQSKDTLSTNYVV
jgi:hypothetical protein